MIGARKMCVLFWMFAMVAAASAGVAPMIQTRWGQGAPYNRATPRLDGQQTWPGCTTLALAQLLNYYR